MLYWLQKEAPRDDGGEGYPEFRLLTDVMGTEDGLSKHPYIRESRRIRAVKTILEQEISEEFQGGARAQFFADSVGVGLYPIDIHPCGEEEAGVSRRTKPFQIPMGSLIPIRIRNLLAAAKNIGTTHITNGAYRLHPVEWNIGEAAGELAAFAVEKGETPLKIHQHEDLRHEFQRTLLSRGVPCTGSAMCHSRTPRSARSRCGPSLARSKAHRVIYVTSPTRRESQTKITADPLAECENDQFPSGGREVVPLANQDNRQES